MTTKCYNCHSELAFQAGDKVTRHDECHSCTTSLHCCRMCEFFDKTVYNECREPNAERILDKEKNNYCDYFKFNGSGNNQEDKNALLNAANSLFKD